MARIRSSGSKSDAFRNSPSYRLMTLMKEFCSASGYYDVFIPALKELSPSYAEYYKKLEAANEKLIARYPGIQSALSG